MEKYLVYFFLSSCLLFSVTCIGDSLTQKGVWNIVNVKKCPNSDELPCKFDVDKRKLNRFTDCYDVDMQFDEAFEPNYQIVVDICMYVDGGCKDYQKLTDESVVNFIKKFAEDNLKKALVMAKIDPPDFPVEPGHYFIEEFLLDKCEFPCDAMVGKFDAMCTVLNADNIPMGCVAATVEFREPENDDELCDKCRED